LLISAALLYICVCVCVTVDTAAVITSWRVIRCYIHCKFLRSCYHLQSVLTSSVMSACMQHSVFSL